MHFLFQTPNCMFQGNCIVDVRTRRFCPHCRLKKCFNMGMKKEMILGRCKSIFVISVDYMSCIMRKPAFCIRENKGVDQLSG